MDDCEDGMIETQEGIGQKVYQKCRVRAAPAVPGLCLTLDSMRTYKFVRIRTLLHNFHDRTCRSD